MWAVVAVLVGTLPPSSPAQAETPVALELVLAVDTSESVDGFEFSLVMQGIARAFRSPEIVELIGRQDGVAVTLFQWSSRIDRSYMVPWHLVTDPVSVLSFAAAVEAAERDPIRGFTAIGGAIDFGVRLIAENGFAGRQRKIDLSGDGRSNAGPAPAKPRKEADALGIVINGLPILAGTDETAYELDTYYRDNVIVGPGAFVEIARGYEDFDQAFKRKLLRELTPVVSRNEVLPADQVEKSPAGSGRFGSTAAVWPAAAASSGLSVPVRTLTWRGANSMPTLRNSSLMR